jgi:hypothetical protein
MNVGFIGPGHPHPLRLSAETVDSCPVQKEVTVHDDD